MERRILGRTGRELSLIGLGGVVFVSLDQEESNALVAESIERGVNYFDVAPSYGTAQETEIKLGDALRDKRENVFVACKTGDRTADGARMELERSLRHLQTDWFDLYQLHAITTVAEVEQAFAAGGAMETILEAQKEGKIRHIGFSAHSEEAAIRAMELYPFDSALFPVNFVTWQEGRFGSRIMSKAQEIGTARLALKAMARTNWKPDVSRPYPHCWYEPLDDPHIAELALRYTLSQPITAAVPPGDPRLFRMALEFAERFAPITDSERAELQAYARGLQPIFQAA
jgi:aryl-alcohol dehydrogenase-like predicted oxidoreductase